MKTLYGTCPNEHLLWRYSMDRTLSIYYWAGDIMPDESKLPVAWGDAGDTVLDETRMAPIDDVKMTMLELEVKDISYWADVDAEVKGEKKADYPQSFFHFLNRLMLGDPVSRYIMPDKAIINEFPNATSDSRVRNFLNHAVPIVWKNVWKKIIGTKTALEKCDIAIENLEKLLDIYGPDPTFYKALAALHRARKEIIHEPLADILDQEYIDEQYARASDELFHDPRESDKKKKTYSDNRDDISKALKKDNVPKVTCRVTYPSEKITGVRVENNESTDSAFKVTVKKDDLDALVGSYNYLSRAEILHRNDPVNHPSHYQLHGGMEVIDIIEAVTWDLPGNEAYAIGNAVKYICRYRNKGKPVQDLEKAKWYLNRAIEDYKKGEEGN